MGTNEPTEAGVYECRPHGYTEWFRARVFPGGRLLWEPLTEEDSDFLGHFEWASLGKVEDSHLYVEWGQRLGD